eukprot:9305210-Ditylum_brightwellii.AAC.1
MIPNHLVGVQPDPCMWVGPGWLGAWFRLDPGQGGESVVSHCSHRRRCTYAGQMCVLTQNACAAISNSIAAAAN